MNYGSTYFDDQQGYIVFNRFRIMEYLTDGLDQSIIQRISKWIEGAKIKLDMVN